MSDFSDSTIISKRMTDSTRRLHELAKPVGRARVIKEYNAELRRSALSIEVMKALKAGESATAAEHIGRGSAEYQAKLKSLMADLEGAEVTIADWHATESSFEAARSLLSFSRETLKSMPE